MDTEKMTSLVKNRIEFKLISILNNSHFVISNFAITLIQKHMITYEWNGNQRIAKNNKQTNKQKDPCNAQNMASNILSVSVHQLLLWY